MNKLAWLAALLAALLASMAASAQTPAPPAPNSDANYRALRNITAASDAISVTGLVLQRDAGRLVLKTGTVCFTPPVNGKVTGAVFSGEGSFSLNPPLPIEQRFLFNLTRDNEGLHEDFTELAMRFGDGTYDEIRKHASGAGGACPAGLLGEMNDVYRKRFHYNIAGRLLEDVLSPSPGGYFAALIKGRKYSSKEMFIIDPNGINMVVSGVPEGTHQRVDVAPEEVAFLTYDTMKDVVWASFHLSTESGGYGKGELAGGIDIQKQKLATQIERSGKLDGDATTTFLAGRDGTRVAAFALFASLRVQGVTDSSGQPLSFIQEEKFDDPNFYVILPRPLNAGESFTIRTRYSGKEAVLNTGGGTYFPVARDDWFPTNAAVPFGDYAEYEMQFRIPKGMTMVATGKRLSESTEGNQNVSTWISEKPQATAGFNFGKFKEKDFTLDKPPIVVQSFANEEVPDMFQGLQGGTLGSLSTVSLMEKPLAEADLAVQIYTNYFGPLSYSHVAMTPQATCGFGQSWPYLVYLPICAYLDDQQRHVLVGESIRQRYWETVGPHEIAHQWWGHTVGFDSYRDQWMSEGFAEFSASLYVEKVYAKDPKMYLDFWKFRRQFLTEKNGMGWRAIDAGPVNLGYRVSNEKFGSIGFNLIYPKGAYILHMLRQMMTDPKNGDVPFRQMMQDFTATYANRIATTEDFKAMVEKHMLPSMDLDRNHRMDWFFNEYVYGTALPAYNLESSFENENGNTMLKLKLTQSNVGDDFKMVVPVYAELADGKIVRLGSATLAGNKTLEQKVSLGKIPQAPKRAIANYYYDVLSTEAK
ncbi:MAG: hypothetical protein JO041_03780 [Acidobacteria bacterium]|nr:hypothetical protein [Acidobacteriota bacterium]